MESCSIVANSSIKIYKHYERRWWAGWIVAGVMMLIAVTLGIFAKVRGDAIDSLQGARQEIIELQERQSKLTDAFIEAWKNQQATTEAILSYGEYHKERKMLVESNLQASKEGAKEKSWK